jgi:hypothetical protein
MCALRSEGRRGVSNVAWLPVAAGATVGHSLVGDLRRRVGLDDAGRHYVADASRTCVVERMASAVEAALRVRRDDRITFSTLLRLDVEQV